MKFVVIDTEGNKALVPMFRAIARPAVMRITTGSNQLCAITNSTTMIRIAAKMITETGGVAPS